MGRGMWITVTIEDEKLGFKFESHTPKKSKSFPWMYCSGCGLVFLRNRFTNWCRKRGVIMKIIRITRGYTLT